MTDESNDNTDTGAEAGSAEVSSAEAAVASAVAPAATDVVTEGARPDSVPEKFWNTETNSINAEAAIKSYTELEGKFGSFTGAPDEYAFNTSEDMAAKFEELGLEIDTTDDPLYAAALEMAKDTGMNQEGFDKLSNLYLMQQLADVEAGKALQAEEIKNLGDRADQRISNLKSWGENNLSPELFEGLQGIVTSAASVQVMEHIIAQTRNAPVSDSAANAAPAFSEGDLRAMQFAKDDNGNRKINTDPSFKADYNRKMKEFYGDAEHRIIVGG